MIKQPQCKPIDQVDQAILLLCIKTRLIKWIPVDAIPRFCDDLIFNFKKSKLRKQLDTEKAFSDKLLTSFTNEIKKYIHKYVSSIKDYQINNYGSKEEFLELSK